jgi:hypothetical protein
MVGQECEALEIAVGDMVTGGRQWRDQKARKLDLDDLSIPRVGILSSSIHVLHEAS